jgi:hypothetical protein
MLDFYNGFSSFFENHTVICPATFPCLQIDHFYSAPENYVAAFAYKKEAISFFWFSL